MAKNMYQKIKERQENKMNKEEVVNSKTNINWYPGHMAKTKREINDQINLIDIVYEVIDSRMPISSKMLDVDNILKNKPRIMVFTKYDLCDQEKTNKFVQYYESLNYTVIPVDLTTGKNVNLIITKSKECLKEMNESRLKKGLKPRNIRALIIGVPNAGKSTLINRLVGKKAVNVGNKPGVTKNISWIRIGKDIELMDTPGILWPKFDNQTHAYNLAALSSIKEEIIDKESLAIYILKTMYKMYPNNLKSRYNIEKVDDENIVEVLDSIAKKRGVVNKNNETDYDKVYNIVIRDIKEGYLGNITID